MHDMLQYASHLPEIAFAPGDVIVHEGGPAGPIWILVSGALQVRKGNELVNTITQPGALVGEISLLLNSVFSATVEAAEPSTMRYARSGREFLSSDPAVITLVAVGLAERLQFVTSYLADLKQQYGDAPGLAMIPEVLRKLSQRQGSIAHPGSARDPDPDY